LASSGRDRIMKSQVPFKLRNHGDDSLSMVNASSGDGKG